MESEPGPETVFAKGDRWLHLQGLREVGVVFDVVSVFLSFFLLLLTKFEAQ